MTSKVNFKFDWSLKIIKMGPRKVFARTHSDSKAPPVKAEKTAFPKKNLETPPVAPTQGHVFTRSF